MSNRLPSCLKHSPVFGSNFSDVLKRKSLNIPKHQIGSKWSVGLRFGNWLCSNVLVWLQLRAASSQAWVPVCLRNHLEWEAMAGPINASIPKWLMSFTWHRSGMIVTDFKKNCLSPSLFRRTYSAEGDIIETKPKQTQVLKVWIKERHKGPGKISRLSLLTSFPCFYSLAQMSSTLTFLKPELWNIWTEFFWLNKQQNKSTNSTSDPLRGKTWPQMRFGNVCI